MTAYRLNPDTRTARLETWAGVAASPPDVTVTLADPRGAVVVDRATPAAVVPVVAGGPTHSYTWTPGRTARLGTWTETWRATIEGQAVTVTGEFEVSEARSVCR